MITFTGSFKLKSQENESKLPVKEFPVSGTGRSFVLLLSGDGGWKDLVKEVAKNFTSIGIPVAGLNSRSYFWREKSRVKLSEDLNYLTNYYMEKWNKKEVILVGYSFGADVIPFAYDSMDKSVIKKIILISPYKTAHFKIKLSEYIITATDGFPVTLQLKKIDPDLLYIICDDDKNSLCNELDQNIWNYTYLEGGHHFNSEYQKLNNLINNFINK